MARIIAVRDGKVLSANWLKSEISIEQALVAEARGDRAAAASAFDAAITIMADSFPQSPALLAAKARKAAFLARGGDQAGALALFDEVVKESVDVRDSSAALRDLLAPYFALLAASNSADAPAAMFRAAQVLQRPGVAQTQAILARQLSEGNDEAAAMFRLAVARTREIARTEGEIARLVGQARADRAGRAPISPRPNRASRRCAASRPASRPSWPIIRATRCSRRRASSSPSFRPRCGTAKAITR